MNPIPSLLPLFRALRSALAAAMAITIFGGGAACAAVESDLLVAFDQTHAGSVGGRDNAQVLAANAVAGSNAINARSGSAARMRIVGYHQGETYNKAATSNGGYLQWLNPGNAQHHRMDDVLAAFNARNADLLAYVCDSNDDGAAAVAQQPGIYASYDSSAFWSNVVAHETGGHNYGCSHQDGHANSTKTVMLHNYCGGGAQGWISTPNVWVNNVQLLGGDSCLGSGPNGGDNAGVMNNAALGKANFKNRISVAPNLGNVVRHWNFNQAAGGAPNNTTVTDSVTGTALATVLGSGATFTGTGIQLPGGAGNSGAAYLNLPSGTVSAYTNVTIEIWAKTISTQNWARVLDLNSSTSNHLALTSAIGTNSDAQRFTSVVGGSSETLDSGIPTSPGVMHHYAVTYISTGASSGYWVWYRDGDEIAYLSVGYALSAVPDTNVWLGRSAFSADNLANAEFSEVRISDIAMSRDEILANFTLGPNRPAASASLTANDPFGQTSFNVAGLWSDGLAPGAGKTYDSYNFTLRTPSNGSPHTFGGQSLGIHGGRFLWKGTSGSTITINDLSLAGDCEIQNAGSGTWTLAGNLLVKPDATALVRGANGSTNLTANLSGGGPLLCVDNSVTLGGSNSSFTGKVIVGDGRAGKLSIDAETRLGANPTSLVPDQLTLDKGTLTTSGTVTLDDPNRGIQMDINGGTFDVTGGTLTIESPLTSADLGGSVTSGLLTKNGSGTLVLNSTTSSFNGMVYVDSGSASANDGILRVTNSQTLAGARSPIYIRNNNSGSSTLELAGGIALGKWVNLSGRNNSTPAIRNISGNNSMQGLLLEGGGGDYRIQSDSGLLTMTTTLQSGVAGNRAITFQGAGGIAVTSAIRNGSADQVSVVKTGAGALTLSGRSDHSGGTTVSEGTLNLDAAADGSGNGALLGTLTINSGATVRINQKDALGWNIGTPANAVGQININGGTIDNATNQNNGYQAAWNLTAATVTSTGTGNFEIRAGNPVTVNASSTQSLIGAPLRLRSQTGTQVTMDVADGAAANDLLISGIVSTPDGIGIEKTGAGTLNLSGNNTYSGATTVAAGRLVSSGSSAGNLTATGGTFVASGTPSTTGNLDIQGGGRFETSISPSTADSLTVAGTVSLAGELDILPAAGIAPAASFVILSKTGAGAVSGTFAGKPEGALFSAGGYDWTISYTGGDGNDVTVTTAAAVTGYAAWAAGFSFPPGADAPSFDAEKDGIANSFEWLLGSDPLASDTEVLPQPTLQSVTAGEFPGADPAKKYLTLTATILKSTPGFTLVAQAADSPALLDEPGSSDNIESIQLNDLGDFEEREWIHTVPVEDAGTGFMRLKITED